MPKTSKKVDIQLLRRLVKEAEGQKEFSNLSKLYEDVANRYNGTIRDAKMTASREGKLISDMFPEVSPSVIMLRIKEYNIPLKTKPGKRGRQPGKAPTREDGQPIKRTTRAEKFKNDPVMSKSLEILREEFPEREGWVDKIAEGSVKYMIKLHCYECSGSSVSISNSCDMLNCPLYLAWKRKN